MELAAHQVLKDGRPGAKLVVKVQQHGRDLRNPDRRLEGRIARLVQVKVELDVGKGVALALGKGAVHKSPEDAFVLLAELANASDHLLLGQRPVNDH